MKAIRVEQTGGPEAMRLVDVDAPSPGAGEVLVRHHAIGVNFIDIYYRSGLYPLRLPSGLGSEAAGVVEATGAGVSRFKPGDRIAYCTAPNGAYAEAHLVKAEQAVKLPDTISFETAAAALLKGLTARYLLRKTFPVQQGVFCLFHAASGGVGQIGVQWAKHLGARVIGVVGSDEKTGIARRLGAEHVIVSTREDIAKRVREITQGEGVSVVYDSVGKDTFQASLDSLAPLGMMVSFGNASGPAPLLDPLDLMRRGALFFTRPSLFAYTRTAALLDDAAADLFAVLESGAVKITPPTRYTLENAAQAHADLEARKTTGSLVLTP